MTTKQKLQQHLAELERGEAFSHERMKDMTELIDKLASPTLPVVRLDDSVNLSEEFLYDIYCDGGWCRQMWYYPEKRWFTDGSYTYLRENVTHICRSIHVEEFLSKQAYRRKPMKLDEAMSQDIRGRYADELIDSAVEPWHENR